MTKTIGLTGGIGSGKSTVAKYFEALGIPVFYSDEEAKKLYAKPSVQEEINVVVNENVFSDGQLDRKRLSELIFSDAVLRKKINDVIHPKVRKRFESFVIENTHKPYVINEAAILFETGAYKRFDHCILVTSPTDLKIERIMLRDGISADTVKERMASQWSDAQKIPLADFIIENHESTDIKKQVEAIHAQLIDN